MSSYPGGSHASTRIQALERERKIRQDDVERRLGNISAASKATIDSAAVSNKFTAQSDTVDHLLTSDTVGLVKHSDFKARREHLERNPSSRAESQAELQHQRNRDALVKRKRATRATLSFQDDADDEEEDENLNKRNTDTKSSAVADADDEKDATTDDASRKPVKRRRFGKDPTIETNFLPDRELSLAKKAERERLKHIWLQEQDAMKNEDIRITYSYWDGSGHRRVMTCKKGTTVGRFLATVQLEFKQLRNISPDALMFIKEDLIIPHHYSFYDFVVMKARGKSGPLFNFDVVEDVRLVADATKEKEDAHAAKVVERRWYERNRHIFPASRWEVFDPSKKYDRYTIHGD